MNVLMWKGSHVRIKTSKIVGSIVVFLTYLGTYLGGLREFVPGPTHVRFQVGLLGLIMLISVVILVYAGGTVN